MPMQLALLHYAAPPVVGGVESVIAHHARLFADAGHHVRIIAGRGASFDPRITFVPLPLADSQHARVLHIKAELDRGVVSSAFTALRDELVAALREALHHVDVVFAHNVCSLHKNLALTAALHQLHAQARTPHLVLWHHDLAWTTPRYRSELHAGYPWDLLRTAWSGAVQVTISEARRSELAALMRLAPEMIHVVPNGLDPAQFYKLEPQTQALLAQTRLLDAALILLLPVRITPRKNIELALRVLAALRADGMDAVLVVTGPLGAHNARNNDYFAHLRALRQQLGLEGAAHFLAELADGFLPNAVISDLFRLCDALFLPSREEGFGLPVIEAAFDRKPIFCSDIPTLREVGGAFANYFSPSEDPAHIAAQIRERLAHETTYHSAVRARQRYTWHSVYRKHLAPLLASLRPQ